MPHRKKIKDAANGQSQDMKITLTLFFFPLQILHSQYLNGKAKEGKALPCSGSFYGTQTIVHAVILGILCHFSVTLRFCGAMKSCRVQSLWRSSLTPREVCPSDQ